MRACNARRTKVPRLMAEEERKPEGRACNEREQNGTGMEGRRRRSDDSHHCLAGLLRFPPSAWVVTVAIAIAPRDSGCERASAARNRKPRLIKRRRAIVNDPPRLVVKDRAGISRSVSRLPRRRRRRRIRSQLVVSSALVNARNTTRTYITRTNAPKIRYTINSMRI